jgi:hypothetical protein
MTRASSRTALRDIEELIDMAFWNRKRSKEEAHPTGYGRPSSKILKNQKRHARPMISRVALALEAEWPT